MAGYAVLTTHASTPSLSAVAEKIETPVLAGVASAAGAGCEYAAARTAAPRMPLGLPHARNEMALQRFWPGTLHTPLHSTLYPIPSTPPEITSPLTLTWIIPFEGATQL